MELKCDFCSAPNPARRFAVKTFSAPNLAVVDAVSVGDWAACDVCAAMIDRDDRGALALRSLESYAGGDEEARFTLFVDIRHMHDAFFDNLL